MATPTPTPVSQCALHQLEVQDGVQAKTYKSSQFSTALTLTIEAQQSENSIRDDLMLLIHSGSRRLSPSGTVCVEKLSQKLEIRVPAQQHEVKVWFVESRDFNLSVCILKKSGFSVQDDTSPAASRAPTSSFQQPLPYWSHETGLGARLSSITPTSNAGTSHGTARFLLSSLRNSTQPAPAAQQTGLPPEFPHGRTHEAFTNGLYLADDSQTDPSRRTTSSSEQAGQLFNPYTIFSNPHGSGSYRPRVSSPLRNWVIPDVSQLHPACNDSRDMKRFTQNQPSELPTTPRSLSCATTASQREEGVPFLASGAPTCHIVGENPPGNVLPQGHVPLQQRSTESSESRSDTLPQRRRLPFTQRQAHTVKGKLDQSVNEKENGPSSATKGPERRRGNLQWQNSDQDPVRTRNSEKVGLPPRKTRRSSFTPTLDGHGHGASQVELVPFRQPPGSNNTSWSPPDATVIVTDANIVRQLSDVTSALLDQYESDVSRGCHREICAAFYLDRLQTSRRNVWYSYLMSTRPLGQGRVADRLDLSN
ncbi:hypothetical protein DCS_07003 [Drechmeria coniospora]|uniref:Uncharacterized protein n=1 Tax=Drechmeria coniospora TaxID=98403 RepID=A0A151GD62_DRECN|nr:hypothetical protein DCS_07003 [Drechmeria coniospora]KYK55042.1 hypothetical protein DCS_07003 [Drechmeria coniospora]